MNENDVLLACKRCLTVQDEMLKEIKHELSSFTNQLSVNASQTKSSQEIITEASRTLKPAVDALNGSRYKFSLSTVLICTTITLLVFSGLVCAAYWYGEHARDLEFEHKLSEYKEEIKSSMSASAKWADSSEGKAAKELVTKLRSESNLDYSALNKESKKILFAWINDLVEKSKKQ